MLVTGDEETHRPHSSTHRRHCAGCLQRRLSHDGQERIHGADNLEHQPAGRRCKVQVVAQADKRNPEVNTSNAICTKTAQACFGR